LGSPSSSNHYRRSFLSGSAIEIASDSAVSTRILRPDGSDFRARDNTFEHAGCSAIDLAGSATNAPAQVAALGVYAAVVAAAADPATGILAIDSGACFWKAGSGRSRRRVRRVPSDRQRPRLRDLHPAERLDERHAHHRAPHDDGRRRISS
jgi:hypothetical protein